MQTISDRFLTRAQQGMRPLAWKCRISFEKQFNDSITFFTIEESEIGGSDFIPADSSDVVQEWDKYVYDDFSDRVIDISVTRQVNPLSPITFAQADIILNNTDDYFTPDSGSPINDYIKPSRPVRLFMGFGDETIPMFIGITEGMPTINETDKTATFHCIDFMTSLMEKPINEAALFVNEQTDVILESLFDLAGISSVQLNLDNGFNIIPYAYFDKDTKLKDAIEKLLQVEMGRIYMNEKGVIQFKNRQDYESTPVYEFNEDDNIFDIKSKTLDDLINVVEVKGAVKQEQPNQKYWELDAPQLIKANDTLEIWADFEDPVTDVDDPEYITSATTSLFTVNTASDGSGDNNATDVGLQSSSQFAKSFKMVFENTGSQDLYITTLELFATPVKTISEIYIREEDTNSSDDYEEHVESIENDFFQTDTDAISIAKMILRDYADFNNASEIDVKGCFALQLDDPIQVTSKGVTEDYKIVKIIDRISFPALYTQVLTLRKFTPTSYFTVAESEIAGSDLIRP